MRFSDRIRSRHLIAVVSLGLVLGCQPSGRNAGGNATPATPDSAASDSADVRAVVVQLGERLQRVSLLAPRTDLIEAIRREYGDLVTPVLIERWIGDPTSAPGRQTSSPWPDHIEIESLARGPEGAWTVVGAVVERTSADAAGSSANRIPVRLTVAPGDGRWLIATYEEDRSPPSHVSDTTPDASAAGAANVIRAYYRAISQQRYRDAYQLWGSSGAASGKSFDEFRAGFSETAAAEVKLGTPGRIEGAAGSRYVDVPVRVTARLRDGTPQEFEGTYTLRLSVVDGATPQQRAWHIDSAKLRNVSEK